MANYTVKTGETYNAKSNVGIGWQIGDGVIQSATIKYNKNGTAIGNEEYIAPGESGSRLASEVEQGADTISVEVNTAPVQHPQVKVSTAGYVPAGTITGTYGFPINVSTSPIIVTPLPDNEENHLTAILTPQNPADVNKNVINIGASQLGYVGLRTPRIDVNGRYVIKGWICETIDGTTIFSSDRPTVNHIMSPQREVSYYRPLVEVATYTAPTLTLPTISQASRIKLTGAMVGDTDYPLTENQQTIQVPEGEEILLEYESATVTDGTFTLPANTIGPITLSGVKINETVYNITDTTQTISIPEGAAVELLYTPYQASADPVYISMPAKINGPVDFQAVTVNGQRYEPQTNPYVVNAEAGQSVSILYAAVPPTPETPAAQIQLPTIPAGQVMVDYYMTVTRNGVPTVYAPGQTALVKSGDIVVFSAENEPPKVTIAVDYVNTTKPDLNPTSIITQILDPGGM